MSQNIHPSDTLGSANNALEDQQTRQHLENMLTDYFDGLHEGDVEKLRRLFHDDVVLKTPGQRRPREDWLNNVATRPVPAKEAIPYRFKVLNIEVINDMAMAKVECPLFEHAYIDFLIFLKENDQWRIVSKVYTDLNR